jgi:hypothetical protein
MSDGALAGQGCSGSNRALHIPHIREINPVLWQSRPMRCAESMVVVDGLDSLESQEQARDHGQWLS